MEVVHFSLLSRTKINDVHSFELNELSTQSAELLPQRTIQIRPSMIKVCKDPVRAHSLSVNSFEVVGMSGRPKKSYLSRYLVLLLQYGGVPSEFVTNIFKDAIVVARTSLTDKRAALQVALASGDIDDDFIVTRMILSGIPLYEPYLQACLCFLTKDQNKSLREGKYPISVKDSILWGQLIQRVPLAGEKSALFNARFWPL